MRFRTPAAVLVLAVVAGEAAAQPVAPPRRPSFGSYSSMLSPGGGYYGYGYGGPGFGYNPYGYGLGFGGAGGAAQQALLLQQLNQNNLAVSSLQQFLAFGTAPVLMPTGRGATFNNLSHWYPTYRGMGVPFAAGGYGGGGFPMMGTPMGRGGLMGAALMGAATGNAVGNNGGGGGAAGGAAAPRTSGSGIPLGTPKR
jgi:hypothetical protein